ncbi:MAG: hypothetical protein QM528_07820 [Phycisphaerales bacterium]|nr:hypothetical protein [Phycisphaerales bacterium]
MFNSHPSSLLKSYDYDGGRTWSNVNSNLHSNITDNNIRSINQLNYLQYRIP